MAPPAPVEMSERCLHVENGPAAPNFPPTLSTERPVAVRPVARDLHLEDYRDTKTHRAPHQPHQAPPPAAAENTHRHAGPAYDFAYRHPGQTHTASSPHHTYERSPFSAGTYTRHSYPEYPRYSEMGHAGAPHDQKQRKRRGNLPKETTDKLRSWFHAHVSHPYPTEDEKQELMRQTGLQMNQISNWFINARRRQLPAMITNARVTSDAISGRSAEGKVLSSTEGSDPHMQQDGLTLSDGEGVPYEEELESFQRYRGSASKRTSV
ncbi:Homeobox protein PKNOX2-like protein [Emericellopsis cladophorae]|uniref:Homeobox protein PKNOX2-like protein n=1 Tax=Emericellopsis cladophorae TaxID=2686198 RepID=A0A9P9XTL8_9HYPO|nr:Homeobox protein PKNOX2-like protein [Emericellopsis cladophorae]KAI6777672.1 Homeobox protein PKNOX2-like protein [Emericellopsis cladophorae]